MGNSNNCWREHWFFEKLYWPKGQGNAGQPISYVFLGVSSDDVDNFVTGTCIILERLPTN